MTKRPRLYIEKENGDEGFGDVEFVAYGKVGSFGELKSYSGLTLVARSEHGSYGDNGCNAAGYYARIYAETGEASFQVSDFSFRFACCVRAMVPELQSHFVFCRKSIITSMVVLPFIAPAGELIYFRAGSH